jgi:phosphoesterase RecJ-like protein
MDNNLYPPEGLLETIQKANRFLITGHIDADPDCFGAVMALKLSLEQMGKTAYAILHSIDFNGHKIIPGISTLLHMEDLDNLQWDVSVVLDCDPQRVGEVAKYLQSSPVIVNIDHHPTNNNFHPHNWIDPSYAATSQMVYYLVKALGVNMELPIAKLLYLGIAGDTGSFRYSNTTSEVFDIASHLVGIGVKPDRVSKILYESMPFSHLKLLAQVIANAELVAEDRVVIATLTNQQIKSVLESELKSLGVIQYLKMIIGVDVAVFLLETEQNLVKVQFRSNENVDVSKIARDLGGGGHKQAAGCQINGSLADIKQLVIRRVIEEL